MNKIDATIDKLIAPQKMLEAYHKTFMKQTSWKKHKRIFRKTKTSHQRKPSDRMQDAWWYYETIKAKKGKVAEMFRQAIDEETL